MNVVHRLADAVATGPSVVTIGNFDGVHRGHRAILDAVGQRARAAGARGVAITFDPHPLWLVAPERAPIPISTLDQRVDLIARSPIDLLLVQEFNNAFRQIPAGRFVQEYLIEALQAECVMVGHNFRFGHGHEGNLDTLRKQWSHAFEVIAVPPVEDRGIAISSSMIRGRIGAGDVSTVRRMLGRCYQIEGRLVPGAGRGRRVTVPTLNLESRNALVPADGVYLTRIGVDGGPLRDAVTNVGVRPTFSSGPGESRTIETHVLDADLPAGSSEARLRFVKRLRDEVRFPDASTLRQRIIHDVGLARRYFRRLALLREEAAVGSRDAGR